MSYRERNIMNRVKAVFGFMGALAVIAAAGSFAAHHESSTAPSSGGAFTTLMVQAQSTTEYTNYLKEHLELFEATNPSAAGVCVTQSGQEYPGQMFVWSAFPNMEAALSASTNYDPSLAPPELAELREVKYGTAWASLKPFVLNPGYEHVQRVKVAYENLPGYLRVISALEEAIQKNGHKDFFVGVFQSFGGGPKEVDTYMTRAITPDGASWGRLLDDFYSQPEWAQAIYPRLMSLTDSLVSDNVEVCEQIYWADAE